MLLLLLPPLPPKSLRRTESGGGGESALTPPPPFCGLGDEEDAEDELAWLPLILLARLSSADDTHPPATSGSTSHAESSTRKAECKRRTFGWFKDRISEASRRSMSRAAESGMHSRLQTLMAQGRLPAVVWAR